MIDEKRLARLETLPLDRYLFVVGYLVNNAEGKELLQLARLGLWAREHGIVAVKGAVEWFTTLSDYQSTMLDHGLEKASRNWDVASNVEMLNFEPLISAVKALPKDHT